MNNIEQIFTNIYEKDLWSNGSGPGSDPEVTKDYRDVLVKIIKNKNIKTVLDYGCGDWQFSKLIDWNNLVDNYTGVDIVKHIIKNNIDNYASDKIKFECITSDWQFKNVDLIICKDVFQHLPNDIIKDLIIKMSKHSKYLLFTNDYYDASSNFAINTDINIGEWRLLDLRLSPWNLSGEVVWDKSRLYHPKMHSLLIQSDLKEII